MAASVYRAGRWATGFGPSGGSAIGSARSGGKANGEHGSGGVLWSGCRPRFGAGPTRRVRGAVGPVGEVGGEGELEDGAVVGGEEMAELVHDDELGQDEVSIPPVLLPVPRGGDGLFEVEVARLPAEFVPGFGGAGDEARWIALAARAFLQRHGAA